MRLTFWYQIELVLRHWRHKEEQDIGKTQHTFVIKVHSLIYTRFSSPNFRYPFPLQSTIGKSLLSEIIDWALGRKTFLSTKNFLNQNLTNVSLKLKVLLEIRRVFVLNY